MVIRFIAERLRICVNLIFVHRGKFCTICGDVNHVCCSDCTSLDRDVGLEHLSTVRQWKAGADRL